VTKFDLIYLQLSLPIQGFNQAQFTAACKIIHPLGIFPILLPYNLELKSIFGGFVYHLILHNMSTTLKMQNTFYFETNKKYKKTELERTRVA
jgi:hypothetical protein